MSESTPPTNTRYAATIKGLEQYHRDEEQLKYIQQIIETRSSADAADIIYRLNFMQQKFGIDKSGEITVENIIRMINVMIESSEAESQHLCKEKRDQERIRRDGMAAVEQVIQNHLDKHGRAYDRHYKKC